MKIFLADHNLFHDVDPSKGLDAFPQLIANLINILVYAVGALSVVFIIVGALRYVTSGGNPQAVAGAKKTIFYAVGGLVLALLSVFIVNFAGGIF